MFHLTIRVPWHDLRWSGHVCRRPLENGFCTTLERIREERDDGREVRLAGAAWGELRNEELPPCVSESGGFMNTAEWTRTFVHVYASNEKAKATHGHLLPTRVRVPEFSTFAVPFRWMLRDRQKAIDEALTEPLPPDEVGPFPSPWVFSRARQAALVQLFFGRLREQESLAFFYCKEGQPLGDTLSRLVVGAGRITKVGALVQYDGKGGPSSPMWDRLIRHSIRPDGEDGFLVPYHDYLAPTGDAGEDGRRRELLEEIAVAVDPSHTLHFSYGSELTTSDVALGTLARLFASATLVKEHGVAPGPWDRRLAWINAQIGRAWTDRGAFPGLGSALEALGLPLGTALVLELREKGTLQADEDPWPALDQLIQGRRPPPRAVYAPHLEAARAGWAKLSEERRQLLQLLARFALTPKQARRWFEPRGRIRGAAEKITDAELLRNPYRIAELDLGDEDDEPVSLGTIDRGLRPPSTIAARAPVPAPSRVDSELDARRLRAALVAVLRHAGDAGDSLLGAPEALERVARLDLDPPPLIGSDWLSAHEPALAEAVAALGVPVPDADPPREVAALQLVALKGQEETLRKLLLARAAKPAPSLGADWSKLVTAAIEDAGGSVDPGRPRHMAALREQVAALDVITSRRLSVLVGRAGTGKTSVLGALLRCEKLTAEGVLLLAPTGKARVRLGKAAAAEALTVAQLLYRCGRYDVARQRPLLAGKDRYVKERTVVIDECSMLPMDHLLAVLQALDLGHVERLILVGDPNQLPPIGVGRPFADLVGKLDQARERGEAVGGALARLRAEVRTSAGAPSDTLRLASWFTREPQSVDADRVLSDLELGGRFNDLTICTWTNVEELQARLLEQLQLHLPLAGPADTRGFDAALGFGPGGRAEFSAPDGAEAFQILSPVRMQSHGVHAMNRFIQAQFRGEELRRARRYKDTLGDEEIGRRDKVMHLRNGKRAGWDFAAGAKAEVHLANGELGVVATLKPTAKGKFFNVLFAGRPSVTVGFAGWDFAQGAGPLELAYAITVHKAQGSEFRKVFVILPKATRLLSRELLYTALTRARDRLVLLVEGTDASLLFDLTRPERSETARRNTNLFFSSVREELGGLPWAEHLIHRTLRGHMVRSKAELVIANLLHTEGLPYEYERLFAGSVEPGRLRPDFSFVDPAGDVIVWEHLGMLGNETYRASWEWKLGWYRKNGLVLGETLFVTEDDGDRGLDSAKLRDIAGRIRAKL